MIRVFTADDQQLVRDGFELLINRVADLQVVGTASNGDEALTLARALKPDVVLMDVQMPKKDGIAAARELIARRRDAKVINLTTFDDDEYIVEGLKAGAKGYLLKDISCQEMAAAIRTVAGGCTLMQSEVAQKVITGLSNARHESEGSEALTEPLTERESEVLAAVAGGLSNREIAKTLAITEGTVKNHMSNLLGKLDARDRTQALIKAQKLGLV